MPAFGGANIFGTCVRMQTSENPRAGQRNAYGGLSGVEYLDQGLRGRYTSVTGRFVCPDVASLNAAELAFRSFKDGNVYALVDLFGNTWLNVMLDNFEPTSNVQVFAGNGVFTRTYSARFEHIT